MFIFFECMYLFQFGKYKTENSKVPLAPQSLLIIPEIILVFTNSIQINTIVFNTYTVYFYIN